MATSTSKTKTQQTSSQTAQILEHVEMLLALYEAQEESVPGGLLEQLDKQASEIENQFKQLDDKIEERLSALESKLESKLDFANGSSEGSVGLTDLFIEKTDAVANSFNAKIEAMFEELGLRVAKISQGIAQQETVVASAPTKPATDEEPFDATTDSASHWHRQKEAMLSKYGIDPEYRPLMELDSPDSATIVAEEPITALPAATPTFSEEDTNEIEAIKEKLNAKLREAEVELSINRANMSRQKANMESAQVELDRRAAAIEEKYAAVLGVPKKRAGFLERLGRHLGGKKAE